MVITKLPKQLAKVSILRADFKALQEFVGGLVQVVPGIKIDRYNGDEFKMLVNEEGNLLRMQPNIRLGSITLVGPVAVISTENNDNLSNSFILQEEGRAICAWLDDISVEY